MGLLDSAPNALRAAGLSVVEMPGWLDRGETDGPFYNKGLILHHDGMGLGFRGDPSQFFNVPAFMSQNGNNGSQFWVSRYGIWYAMANGRKWHAGTGQGWNSIPASSGNSYCVGVETDHTIGDPWEQQQLDSIAIGCRALANEYSYDVDGYCCGHKEYAPDRKIDPESFDLNAWRAYVKGSTTVTGGFGTMDDATINAKFQALSDKLDSVVKAISIAPADQTALNVGTIGAASVAILKDCNTIYNNTKK